MWVIVIFLLILLAEWIFLVCKIDNLEEALNKMTRNLFETDAIVDKIIHTPTMPMTTEEAIALLKRCNIMDSEGRIREEFLPYVEKKNGE